MMVSMMDPKILSSSHILHDFVKLIKFNWIYMTFIHFVILLMLVCDFEFLLFAVFGNCEVLSPTSWTAQFGLVAK